MSVDERILQALEVDARIPPYDETTTMLAAVVSRTRRRRMLRRALVAVAAAVVALAIAVVIPAVLDRAGTERDLPLSLDRTTPPVTPAVVAFTYRSPYRAPANGRSRFGIEGHLRLTLGADGTGILRGPKVPVSSFSYTVTGFSIAVELWTDSRCAGDPAGQYALGGRAREVVFSLIHDPCAARRWALLGGPRAHPWVKVPS